MAMKRLFTTATLILFVGLLALAAVFLLPRRLNAPEIEPVVEVDMALNVPLAAPVDDDATSDDEEEMPEMELIVPEILPYFPPPSYELTGASLGRQRVPGTQDIGDVFRMYFHDPTGALFMATTEADGLRSIWRLGMNGKVERVFAANYQPGEIRIFGTSDGTIYVQHNNPSRMYRTDNAFMTWQTVLDDFGLFWGMADDGRGTVYGTLHDFNRAILYRSTDYGFSWHEWKDFQSILPDDAVTYSSGDARFRLRHLHDVIYNDRQKAIIIGTGDVARYTLESRDDGETWSKVWDEGFTSHVVVSGGSRYLLGPDKLRGPGISLYDVENHALQEVWSPGRYNYAGYVYSMVNVDGIYYAAIHTESNEVNEVVPKFGVIVSPDGQTWYPLLEYGPLTHHARTDIWLAATPGTIYASMNGAVYAFTPLSRDWFEFNIRQPFE